MARPSQLPHVAARRLARQKILADLEGMELADRRFILEELLQDLDEEEARATAPVAAQKVARPDGVPPPIAPSARVLAPPPQPQKSLADHIYDYCKRHPTHDKTFEVKEIARHLVPGRPTAPVYTAIVRSSPQSDRDPKPSRPRFVWLGSGKFRLYEPSDEKEAGS
jgi:hypothetical protein